MTNPLEYFRMEAAERLERLSTGLMALEQSPDDTALIGDLFREAHSLKGAAGVSGLSDLTSVCHGMEDVLSGVRAGRDVVNPAMVDILLEATDAVEQLVAATYQGATASCGVAVSDLLVRLAESGQQGGDPEQGVPGDTATVDADIAGVEDTNVDDTDAAVQDTPATTTRPASVAASAPTPMVESRPSDTPSADSGSTTESDETTVRLRVGLLETIGNHVGELMVSGDRLRQRLAATRDVNRLIRAEITRHQSDDSVQQVLRPIAAAMHRLVDEFATDTTAIEPLIANIHESVLDARMLPLRTLFDQMPRFVRDFCRREDRQVHLDVDDVDTRVDRQVLEQLRDPIIHLIRNALSHGLESPDERTACGKDPIGTISLRTSRHSDRIRVTCEDDGRGIDRRRVLAKAIGAGLTSEASAADLEDSRIDEFILHPGFSTADMITDVSGRGVGMDVVLSRMDSMRGTLGIESEPGRFTRFVLEFPASVATLEGLLVEAAGHTYIVPTTAVVCTARLEAAQIQSGAGGEALLNLEGKVIPLLMLANLLDGTHTRNERHDVRIVVVRHRDREVALGLERLLGTQTIVRKSLGNHIGSVYGVAGATILGTGLPALILEPAQLVQACETRRFDQDLSGHADEVEEELAPLLVVDDSITTRIMEQNILESAGYTVDTAVSAEDALEMTKNTDYRLIVSDVEMPGLNGFELTRKLREDQRFANTPIIIVSSLAKEEHRRMGLESGANAYIVKGDFDQNSLLDTVERLVGR